MKKHWWTFLAEICCVCKLCGTISHWTQGVKASKNVETSAWFSAFWNSCHSHHLKQFKNANVIVHIGRWITCQQLPLQLLASKGSVIWNLLKLKDFQRLAVDEFMQVQVCHFYRLLQPFTLWGCSEVSLLKIEASKFHVSTFIINWDEEYDYFLTISHSLMCTHSE